ncbi:AraC family transcriptional regulator [Mycobacterium sp. Root265]|uniref:helix-turn-helix transcriptional regulator n=1 Tax=Mycobacterium sp. Root265 TaxID=1736504 RepID=UPI0007099B63|nr:AraC family transcriptional regulator [Mycobacterium sp. Root265]KRD04879.1 AraC family transcriptional regulator [Mycobacterium sp. Root265]
MAAPARLARHRDGVPVYAYAVGLDTPPVSLIRLRAGELPESRPHIHDFPALTYFPACGTVFVAAAGEAVDPTRVGSRSDATGVFFDPAALGAGARSPWPTWRAHPLLFPFQHEHRGGMLELQVPVDRRPFWDNAIESISTELGTRRDGYRQAALAHLTLLLIDLARLADDVVDDLAVRGTSVVAEVLAVIERRLAEPLSLREVADELGLTPGHLTTVVRRRTGRTVGDWILDRRMSEARVLLAETDLPISEVARRVGVPDPGYFARLFGREHGVTPRRWRAGVRTV